MISHQRHHFRIGDALELDLALQTPVGSLQVLVPHLGDVQDRKPLPVSSINLNPMRDVDSGNDRISGVEGIVWTPGNGENLPKIHLIFNQVLSSFNL